MSKSFINVILQKGNGNENGKLCKADKVKALNEISKAINNKMKKLEYEYKIKFKLNKLPESNEDCIPKRIGIQSFAQINGPIRGQIPIYTTAEIAMPSISTVDMGVPLTPFGPFVGVQGLAINPFGTTADRLNERIKKAQDTIEKVIEIKKAFEDKLPNNNNDNTPCEEIINKNPDLKKYVDCVKFGDEIDEEELKKRIDLIIEPTK